MFDGNIFFGVTGTPIRKTALVNKALADADPVPFTFANLTTKSFIGIITGGAFRMKDAGDDDEPPRYESGFHCSIEIIFDTESGTD